jgi:hypothetical protein
MADPKDDLNPAEQHYQQTFGSEPSQIKTEGPGPENLADAEQNSTANEEITPRYDSEIKNLMAYAGLSPEEINAPFGKEPKSRFGRKSNNFFSKRAGMMLAGGLVSAAIAAIIVGFGLISNFKLEHLFQNVDRVSFAKYNSAFDRRSDKWFNAYLTMRLTDFSENNSGESSWFRSRSVDEKNPAKKWYKNMRASRFEADLAKKGFIIESSYDHTTGKVKQAILRVNIDSDGTPIHKTVDFSDLKGKSVKNGDLEKLLREKPEIINTKLSQVFDSDKEARRGIKKLVNDETKSWQWYKRKTLRKDIQSMTGIRSWRFFETTRDKIASKKDSVKRKMIKALVPETTKAGRFLNCLLGTGACNSTSDPASPANEAGDAPADGKAKNEDSNIDHTTNSDNKDVPTTEPTPDISHEATNAAEAVVEDEAAAAAAKGTFIREIVNKISTGVGYIQMADNIKRLHNNISKGVLSKMVIAAKMASVIAAYTTFHTISDQAKSGDIARATFDFASKNPDEFNEVMKGLNGFERSEMYDAYFPSPSQTSFLGSSAYAQGSDTSTTTPDKIASRSEYCSDTHKPQKNDYAYLCADTKVGGKSNAETFEDAYKNTAGKVIGPFVSAYSAIRNTPGIKQLADLGISISDKLSSFVSSIMKPILDATGLSDKLGDVLKWLMGKIMELAGVGPGVMPSDPAGKKFNAIGQGGLGAAQSSSRLNGASISTAQSSAYLNKLYAEQQKDKLKSMSLTARFMSLNNPDSLLHRSLFAINTSIPPAAQFASSLNPFSTIASAMQNSVGVAFLGTSNADSANSKPYATSGITQYDIPPQCIDTDPLTSFQSPSDGTNADEVLGIKLDWETVTDQKAFWAAVYNSKKVADSGNPDSITEQIYNCNLFDETVRDSISKGYQPVTTNDDVLGVDVSSNSGTKNIDDGNGEAIPESETAVTSNGGGIRVAKSLVPKLESMIDAAAKDGVSLTGGGWRDMAAQIKLREEHGCGGPLIYDKSCKGKPRTAIPSTSNHEKGLAIDFHNCSAGSRCFKWLKSHAAEYGFYNLPDEAWHWSTDGS